MIKKAIIRCMSEEQSLLVQNTAFGLGWKWCQEHDCNKVKTDLLTGKAFCDIILHELSQMQYSYANSLPGLLDREYIRYTAAEFIREVM